MITGIVHADEGRIRLRVSGPRGRTREVEAVVDTGYTDWLTLPADVITALRLRFWSLERCVLADGSECRFEVYVGTVEWDGKERDIHVDKANTVPLVGMKLMKGYELKMQVRPRGKITIKRLGRK